MNATAPAEFRLNDDVRLLGHHGDIRSGTRGCIIGKFNRPTDPAYLVSFEGEEARVISVRSDELIRADV